MKHISPTFMYIIPMYLRLTTFTKTLPQMSFHLYFFGNYYFALGSTHDSVDCWSAHRSPAARDSFKLRQLQSSNRDSFKRVNDWCMAGLTLAIRQFAIGESRSLLAKKNQDPSPIWLIYIFFFFFFFRITQFFLRNT